MATVATAHLPVSKLQKSFHSILHLPVTSVFKAPLLFVVVIVGSTFDALDVMNQETPLSNVRNPVNQYFVKFSWGWSLLVLVPTALITSVLYTAAMDWKMIGKHMGRLAVSHIIWFVVTSLFVAVDSATGTCADETTTERSACLKGGHRWYGFDISGHVFLLTYCIFVLTEECAGIAAEVWGHYAVLLQEQKVGNKLLKEDLEQLSQWHQKAKWLVRVLEFLATIEVVLMAVMVCATALYFHTFVEKLLGYVFALVSWYLTYRWLYGKPYCPARPEEGVLNPLRFLP